MAYGSQYEFPHSQVWDSDLRQILAMYFTVKALPTEWNNYETNMNTMWKDYKDLMNGNFEDLQNFVNNYFDNLDVQEEINNKIAELVENGTLQEIITPIVQTMANPIPVDSISKMTNQQRIYLLTTTGYLYYYVDNSWTSTGLEYGSLDANEFLKFKGLVSELGVTKLSTVIATGVYYISTNEMLELEDRPFDWREPAILIIYPLTSTAIEQYIQSINTTMAFIRRINLDSNTIGYWHSVFGNGELGSVKYNTLGEYMAGGYYTFTQKTLQVKPDSPFSDENATLINYVYSGENGNGIMQFLIGWSGKIRMRTKKFTEDYSEWHSIIRRSSLVGKKIAILGDSISTHGNSGDNPNEVEITIKEEDVGITLSAYLTYYDVQANLKINNHIFTSDEIGTEVTFSPIYEDIGKKIGLPNNYNENTLKVWWQYIKDEFETTMLPVCWSGASITDHEKTNKYLTSWAFHPAQIRKCGIRNGGAMKRTSPDVIIIYRGVNDFSHSPYAQIENDYFENINWKYPITDVEENVYYFLRGLAMTINELRIAYPLAEIVLCTLNVFKRINYANFPTNNGYSTLPQYNEAIRKAAKFFGCKLIDFEKDGITFENCYPTYISDSKTTPTHPNATGHKKMGEFAVRELLNKF